VVEPIPIVVVGDFTSPELSTTFIGLGATRVLPKPVSPDVLRRTLTELRDHGSPALHTREPLGELNVSQLVDRLASELRRGLVEAVDPAARSSAVGFGEGTDVMSAVWGTVARLRELVTLKSDGNVRFEQTGPEGAVPLAPWNDNRRVGERGGRDNRAGEGVTLQGRRVVVADDDPAVVWFLSGILKAVGAEVHEAHDGERAFELTASLWPDLVVSDVLMPKLDGFSLCHEIKRDVAVRDVPVILLSWKEDLLQRVRELGGDADGYLRKEAAASTVVERLREVLRARARVEQRVASGGEVRGRLDGLTPRLVLELACRAQRDARVSIRDSSYLYEIQVRAGAPRTAIRSANDGSFERGEGVLAMLLGVSAGRFVIEPDDSNCRPELSGTLHEQLAGPVARARAAQKSLSAGALVNVSRVAFDAARVGGYLECTPEPAQSLLRELIGGASPRDLLTSGRAPARLLEAVLSDFARRGAILLVESAAGVEDISQTRVPPTVAPPLAAISLPQPEPEIAAAKQPEPEPPAPVSQRRPPAIYSQPPADAEMASADAGWFSFQIESSAKPPEAVAEPTPVTEDVAEAELVEAAKPLPRAEDPLRRTLTSSSAPPAADDEAPPGASVPVERGYRPEFRTETLGSAGNEAAAAIAAVAADESSKSPSVPRPAPKPPRPSSPSAPRVVEDEDDPLAQALVETPPPVAAAPVVPVEPVEVAPAEPVVEVAPALPLDTTLALEQAPAKVEEPKVPERSPWRSDSSTQPPKAATKTAVMPAVKAPPAKAAARKPAEAPEAEAGGWGRTALFALIAAGASYWGVTALFGNAPAPAPASTAPSAVTPVPTPVVTPAAPTAPKLRLSITDSALPPGTDVPSGHGLLELNVPDGTAIRVDGDYLGMGPARLVPLAPGAHQLTLGDAPAQSVDIKQGQRTLVVATDGKAPAPAGSP
jgi:DNA-binding response OmpR family regulator